MRAPLDSLHVAVLLGGPSSEREVSLESGRLCADALEGQVAKVTRVDAGADLAQVLTELKPDVVFNALHGSWGEDGCVQGILETLEIPYTHSGVMASALAMDKFRTKVVVKGYGVGVPGGDIFDAREVASRHVLPVPYVAKPNRDGSSVGVHIVKEGDNPPSQFGKAGDGPGKHVLVEPFIPGRELCVAVLGEADGPRALTVTEITSDRGFYDYEAKYAPGGSRHIVPAPLPEHVFDKALRWAEAAHAALDCRGISRSDFRYDDVKDELVFLEVNTQPGMTPTSLAPEQAAYVGMDYRSLVRWLVEDASCRR